jgi:hypothetical protein
MGYTLGYNGLQSVRLLQGSYSGRECRKSTSRNMDAIGHCFLMKSFYLLLNTFECSCDSFLLNRKTQEFGVRENDPSKTAIGTEQAPTDESIHAFDRDAKHFSRFVASVCEFWKDTLTLLFSFVFYHVVFWLRAGQS